MGVARLQGESSMQEDFSRANTNTAPQTDPREIFNFRLWFVVCGAMFAGMFYGFDIGNIGGVMTFPAFKHAFGFNDLTQSQLDGRKGDIAAMVAAGASIGSLAGAPVADYWGRRIALLTYGVIFTGGAVMQE
jgi:MFS family permease